YSIDDLDENAGFIHAVASACRAQGIPADTAVAEYAPGQFEINLAHRADALAACDDAVLLKRVIKAVAQQHGALASFMAKPLAGQAGSGMHLHVSLLDRDGRNVFACSPDAPADALRYAVAGLQASASTTCCCSRRTPTVTAASSPTPSSRSTTAGASTTARWPCAFRTATRPTPASSSASPAPTPIPTRSPPRCWRASCTDLQAAGIRARRWLAMPTNSSRCGSRTCARRSTTLLPAAFTS